MKRLYKILIAMAFLGLFVLSSSEVRASNRLELGVNFNTTAVFDDSFEFFSYDYLALPGVGLDFRILAFQAGGIIDFLPLIAFSASSSKGEPAMVDGYMETSIEVRELSGGLRIRGWLLPWIGAFLQADAGASWLDMKGTVARHGNSAMHTDYEYEKRKFRLGSLLGVELRIDPNYLKKRGVNRFNLGGHVGVGLVKRWQTKFAPELKGGDDFAISDDVRTANFGDFNLSGFVFQIGLTVAFL